jgi:mercuric ion binding protein
MKTYSFFISLITLFFFSLPAFAQKSKTENIKVWGNCSMCKKTIETAAKDAGATEASWNTQTKILAVTYNPKKVNNEKIQKAVAASGYDTQDFTAPSDVYQNLEECCQYDRKNANASADTAKASCCDTKECKKGDGSCCKNGKCESGKDCCKDAAACKEKGCCKS